MFIKSFDTSMKTSTPLSYCGIDDALIEFIPRGDDTFSQLTDVLHVVFVNLLLDPTRFCSPDCSVNFGGQRVRGMKSGASFFNISTVLRARCAGALS